MNDLPERLRSLADSLVGDEWEHPITAEADCRAAADEIERMTEAAKEGGVMSESRTTVERNCVTVTTGIYVSCWRCRSDRMAAAQVRLLHQALQERDVRIQQLREDLKRRDANEH